MLSDIQRKDAEMEKVRSEIKQIKTEKRAEISKLIKKSNVEKSYLKQINADLQRRVDDVEVKARNMVEMRVKCPQTKYCNLKPAHRSSN